MSEIRAVIDASAAPVGLLIRPILGVPLVLWSFGAARRVLQAKEVALICAEPAVLGLASSRGLSALGPRRPERTMRIDPLQPLCRRATLEESLESDVAELVFQQAGVIERLRAEDDESFELLAAAIRGLDPENPHVVGVTSLRLPLAQRIDAIVSDVDGVLTDGGIAYADGGAAGRVFNTHDGMGVKRLREAGIKVAWLSATTSGESIERRGSQIEVDVIDAGAGEKGARFESICDRLGVDAARTLYLGDDVNDLPAMMRAGLSACPSDARPEVRGRVDLILDARGGHGAFREASELVLSGQDLS